MHADSFLPLDFRKSSWPQRIELNFVISEGEALDNGVFHIQVGFSKEGYLEACDISIFIDAGKSLHCADGERASVWMDNGRYLVYLSCPKYIHNQKYVAFLKTS